ncbi:hypothetical protein AMTR_s00031p00106900 [Amborella trichopoda]|uniref:Uncharacterized protein n=1 Tax=Amborella trichopoda TaxID=13333 RepID=U5D296_AMBTC|nr:hypothetical protein AMTR_s00031p00106900 [Amborella trichopoda]
MEGTSVERGLQRFPDDCGSFVGTVGVFLVGCRFPTKLKSLLGEWPKDRRQLKGCRAIEGSQSNRKVTQAKGHQAAEASCGNTWWACTFEETHSLNLRARWLIMRDHKCVRQ